MEFFLWVGLAAALTVALKARQSIREAETRISEMGSRNDSFARRIQHLELLLQLDPSLAQETAEASRSAEHAPAPAESVFDALDRIEQSVPTPAEPVVPE